MDDQPIVRDRRALLANGGGALACLLAYWGVALRYDGFRIPYGAGVQEIHPGELVFWAWFVGLGLPAMLLCARALDATRLPERLIAALRPLAELPRGDLAVALIAVLLALGARAFVLQAAPVADDESTYVFIARTLLAGQLVNPSPGDVEFFRNQFVIIDGTSWFGKYPIGHPLVLALGEAIGLRVLVGPLLTGASVLLALAVGRLAFDRPQAALGAALLLLSPQFLLTGATELSQTSSTFALLLALYALLRLDAGAPLRLAALAGAALGFGVLARPMPGVLFVIVAGAWALLRFRSEPLGAQLRRLAAGAAPLLVFAGVLALTHALQTGDPLRSGYGAYHETGYTRGLFDFGWVATSFAGAFVRQNFWLFGWPLSFVFLAFTSRDRRSALLWSVVAASYAYRILVPKTVVSSTGPIYVAEIVPVLALLSANGMANAASWLSRHAFVRGPERVAGLAAAGVAVALTAFLPVHLRDLHRSAEHRTTVHRLLDEAGAEASLVFAPSVADGPQLRSWAYYAENPSPDLSDERIFVRLPQGADGPERAHEFWQRRFPDRQAWVFMWVDGQPRLSPFVPRHASRAPGPIAP